MFENIGMDLMSPMARRVVAGPDTLPIFGSRIGLYETLGVFSWALLFIVCVKYRLRFHVILLSVAACSYASGLMLMHGDPPRYGMLPVLSYALAVYTVVINPAVNKRVRFAFAPLLPLFVVSILPIAPISRPIAPVWNTQIRTIYMPARRGAMVRLTVAPKGWYALLIRK